MDAASQPIQSSAAELKTLLEKSGQRVKPGATLEKEEIVGKICNNLEQSLKPGPKTRKMTLTLADVNAFLAREGVEEATDSKSAITKIALFRSMKLERLQGHIKAREDRKADQLAALDLILRVLAMDDQHLQDCLGGVAVWTPSPDASSSTQPYTSPAATSKLSAGGSDPVADLDAQQSSKINVNEVRDMVADILGVQQPPSKKPRTDASGADVPALEFDPADAVLLADVLRLMPVGVLAIEDSADGSAASTAEKEAVALREIDRILKAEQDNTPVLLGSTVEERFVAFRQVVMLLHLDVDLLSTGDARATQAFLIALKAFVQSERSAK